MLPEPLQAALACWQEKSSLFVFSLGGTKKIFQPSRAAMLGYRNGISPNKKNLENKFVLSFFLGMK